MTSTPAQVPEPLDYHAALELKKELCRSLGWNPNDVMRIEMTASFFKVTDRNRLVHTLVTQNLTTSEWTTHYPAGYGHADNLK